MANDPFDDREHDRLGLPTGQDYTVRFTGTWDRDEVSLARARVQMAELVRIDAGERRKVQKVETIYWPAPMARRIIAACGLEERRHAHVLGFCDRHPRGYLVGAFALIEPDIPENLRP